MSGPALGKNLTLARIRRLGLAQEEPSTKGILDIDFTSLKHSGFPRFSSNNLEYFHSMTYCNIMLNIYNHACNPLPLNFIPFYNN